MPIDDGWQTRDRAEPGPNRPREGRGCHGPVPTRVDRERWTRRVILAGYAASVLTIALGAALGVQVLILGGLIVLAVLLVFARA